MGANSSTSQNPKTQNPSQPTSPNPPSSSSNMSSSNSPNSQNPDPKTLDSQNPDPKSLNNQNPDSKTPNNQNRETPDQLSNQDEKGSISEEKKEIGEEQEEEEEGECGFCLFMKGGGCKEAFVAWEECVEEAEKNKEDIVEKCFKVTGNLKDCMQAHSDYYEPILRAEKAAEEEVKQELDREAEKKSDETNAGLKGVEGSAEIEVQKEG